MENMVEEGPKVNPKYWKENESKISLYLKVLLYTCNLWSFSKGWSNTGCL